MKRLFYLVIISVALAACSSPKEKTLEAINKLEASDSVFSPQVMELLKNAYVQFADAYPDDEQSAVFLFKAAQRCNGIAQHQDAITLLDRIIRDYSNKKIAEDAMFLKAYIQENSLQMHNEAKQTYETFLQQYPESAMADDAKIAIEFIGMSTDEIWEIIQSKQ